MQLKDFDSRPVQYARVVVGNHTDFGGDRRSERRIRTATLKRQRDLDINHPKTSFPTHSLLSVSSSNESVPEAINPSSSQVLVHMGVRF